MSTGEHTPADPRAWEAWDTPPGVPGRDHLELLAADAAARAAAMLAGAAAHTGTAHTGTAHAGTAAQPHDPLRDPLIDAVRLLASAAGARHTARAAHLTGVPEEDLRRLVLAHRHGGAAGVAAAREATPCGTAEMAAAVDEVRRRRTFAVGELSVAPGTITDAGAGVRLRLGPDGRWYPSTLARGQWWPASGASASAGAAYQAAARARALRRASG